jgi:hypothetical protein
MLSGDDLTIALFFGGTAITIALTAMSTAGWRHPVLIRGLFGLAAVCAVIGMAWPVLKTLSPAVTAMVNEVARSPIAWFAVLMLGMAAVLVLPKRGGGGAAGPPPEARRGSPQQPVPASAPTPKPKPQKVFVNVSPSYLLDLYNDRTTLQGDALASTYIGKWITATFKVYDISQPHPSVILIQSIEQQFFDPGGLRWISASFIAESSEEVLQVQKDATITVRGKISSVDKIRVTIDNCELVTIS